MDAKTMEVYCMNIQCGDPEAQTGALVHYEARKYRRMNYMGRKEVKQVKVIADTLLNKPVLPKGQYHFYNCPVCGAERVFHEYKGLFTEIDRETAGLAA